MNVERQQVHSLIDKLAPSQVAAVRTLLNAMLDPVSRAIANAPVDDELESDVERRAVAEADQWLMSNTPIPFEDVLAGFGLTRKDVEAYQEPE